ncbi:MAG: LysR family transcriptional regulator [Candidatus Binatia bacterium]
MKAPRQAQPQAADGAAIEAAAPAVVERRRADLDARLLRTFVTIVDVRSFTRAGRRLGLSQSAISQQVAAQERQLGVKLLVRSGTGVRPTPAGELLLHYARQILAKVDEAQRMLTVYDATGASVLRLGAGGAACEHLLPPILQAFHEEFPRVELRVLSGPSPRSIERLVEGDLDAALLSLPLNDPKLRIFEIGRDELVAIVAPNHELAGRKRIEVGELAGRPLLVYERRSSTFRLVERALLEASIFPRIVMELDHLGAVASMVRAGLGLAIVPRWAIADDLAEGRLAALSIGKSGLARAWGLGLRAEDHQPQTLRAFVRLCLERLPTLLSA